jgi:hypothetical protein
MKKAIILISILTLLVASFGVVFLMNGADEQGELAHGFLRWPGTGDSVELDGFWCRPAMGASLEIAGFWRPQRPPA